MASVLEKIRNQVNAMSAEQVRDALEKLKVQKEKQKEYHKTQVLSPEAREKRKEYNKSRAARPEVKEKMKAYRERPETKEKMTEYRKERYQRQKALIARAKELGLEV